MYVVPENVQYTNANKPNKFWISTSTQMIMHQQIVAKYIQNKVVFNSSPNIPDITENSFVLNNTIIKRTDRPSDSEQMKFIG